MDLRRYTATVAGNVVSAIRSTGNTTESVAEATDIDMSAMESRLTAETPFTFAEIVRVGGFLHVPAHVLAEGVAA